MDYLGRSSAPLIRASAPHEGDTIARLAQEANMGELSEAGSIYVAEANGAIVGFIRLMEAEGHWYVNPIVTDPAHQRQGVGAALMRFARERFGPLRFVARGYAVPFYERLGCVPIPWEQIAFPIAQDCDGCEMLPGCHPRPMMLP